jgi:hypothetical protein
MEFPRVRIVSDSADDSSDIVDDMSESRDECRIRFINEGVTLVFENWCNVP